MASAARDGLAASSELLVAVPPTDRLWRLRWRPEFAGPRRRPCTSPWPSPWRSGTHQPRAGGSGCAWRPWPPALGVGQRRLQPRAHRAGPPPAPSPAREQPHWLPAVGQTPRQRAAASPGAPRAAADRRSSTSSLGSAARPGPPTTGRPDGSAAVMSATRAAPLRTPLAGWKAQSSASQSPSSALIRSRRAIAYSVSLTARSSPYFAMACATISGFTSPMRASSASTATVIDSASTWKKRRAAGAGIGEAPAVGAKRGERRRHPAGDLIRDRTDPVADCHDRPAGGRQCPGHVRDLVLGLRLKHVPFLALKCLAPKLSPGCSRPRSGPDTPIVGEQALCVQRPPEAHAGREDLRLRMLTRCGGPRTGVIRDDICRQLGRSCVAVQPAQDGALKRGGAARRSQRARQAGRRARCRRSGSRRCPRRQGARPSSRTSGAARP